jgi:hypothetical protein
MGGDVGPATSEMVLVLAHNDAQGAYTALYHDERGVCRVFAMTFDDSHWILARDDPDMFQRFIADVGPDRIAGRWEASEDHGSTWRKDFDLIFERTQQCHAASATLPLSGCEAPRPAPRSPGR